MANTTPLPTVIQTKGLLLSRNSEVVIFTMSQPVGNLDACGDTKVEARELKCTGSREKFICTAINYLCNPGLYIMHEL